MHLMDVLTTRTLRYTDESGGEAEKEVVLTIFAPFEKDHWDWVCMFDFEPPIKPSNPRARGLDLIGAFVYGLIYARLYFETTSWSRTGHWQGLRDCGLPMKAEGPLQYQPPEVPPPEDNPGTLEVFATRWLPLDGLALARATYESMLPKGWAPSESGDLLHYEDLPFKIGRSFWTGRPTP
jgi:hypothetical protein